MAVKVERDDGTKKDPSALPEQEPTREELTERLQKLMSGKELPHNDMTAYLIGEMRKVLGEADHVRKLLMQHRETAAQLERRAQELRGMQLKYTEDIQVWDAKKEEEVKK